MLSHNEAKELLEQNQVLAQAILNSLKTTKIRKMVNAELLDPLIDATTAKLKAIDDLLFPSKIHHDKRIISGIFIEPSNQELKATLDCILSNWGHYLTDTEFCSLVRGRHTSDVDELETRDIVMDILEHSATLDEIAARTFQSPMRTSVLLRKLIT